MSFFRREEDFYEENLGRCLYLCWLSAKDITLLKEGDNKIALSRAWGHLKSQLTIYFDDSTIPFESIISACKKINLTANPRIWCCYAPYEDLLVFNLWVLLFTPTTDGFVVPSDAWVVGRSLVHEFDHHVFCEEHGMIGKKAEGELEEFVKSRLTPMEKRAFSSEISFLENCKRNVPDKTRRITKIRDVTWTANGNKIEKIEFSPVLGWQSRLNVIQDIDETISRVSATLSSIQDGAQYRIQADDRNLKLNLRIAQALSLPVQFDEKLVDYPMVEIEM